MMMMNRVSLFSYIVGDRDFLGIHQHVLLSPRALPGIVVFVNYSIYLKVSYHVTITWPLLVFILANSGSMVGGGEFHCLSHSPLPRSLCVHPFYLPLQSVIDFLFTFRVYVLLLHYLLWCCAMVSMGEGETKNKTYEWISIGGDLSIAAYEWKQNDLSNERRK